MLWYVNNNFMIKRIHACVFYTCVVYIYIYIYIYYVAMVTVGLYIAYTPHQYST